MVPELTDAPAWPVLRSQLMLLAASGANPIRVLETAVRDGGLDDARDPAAVLSWRLDWVERGGPLPWLSGIPTRLAEHPQWGPVPVVPLGAGPRPGRAGAGGVWRPREHRWQEALSADLSPELVAHVSVWRAAMGVPADDLSPTGSDAGAGCGLPLAARPRRPPRAVQPDAAALDGGGAPARSAAAHRPADSGAGGEARLAGARRARTCREALASAMRRGPLPDDHAASALLYRLERRPRQEPIREVWETVEPTESMGQRHERMRPPGLDRSHGHGIGI